MPRLALLLRRLLLVAALRARRLLEPALELATRSGVDRIVSHRIPLAEAAHGYRIFDGRLDGATKVLLEP